MCTHGALCATVAPSSHYVAVTVSDRYKENMQEKEEMQERREVRIESYF